jgi:hypothetical protein
MNTLVSSLTSSAKAVVVAMSLIFVAGCATKPSVSTDYEASYNFAALKTFAVKAPKIESRDDLLISPFTLSHVQAQVSNELVKRYHPAAGESSADFLVTYHVVMEEKLDPNSYDELYGYGFWGRGYRYPSPLFYRPMGGIRVYTQGSLIIDMVDAKTQQPIWRGVSEKRLNRGASPQQQREILTAAYRKCSRNFPPLNS